MLSGFDKLCSAVLCVGAPWSPWLQLPFEDLSQLPGLGLSVLQAVDQARLPGEQSERGIMGIIDVEETR